MMAGGGYGGDMYGGGAMGGEMPGMMDSYGSGMEGMGDMYDMSGGDMYGMGGGDMYGGMMVPKAKPQPPK
jgi:hypothetical protein